MSRMLQQAVAWFGFPVWVFRKNSPKRPGEQLADFINSMDEPPIVGLFTDAGGPYGVAKRGLLNVAKATNAQIVPFAVRSDPVVVVRGWTRYALPPPYAKLRCYHGEPLDGATATLADMTNALKEVDMKAHGFWPDAEGGEGPVDA